MDPLGGSLRVEMADSNCAITPSVSNVRLPEEASCALEYAISYSIRTAQDDGHWFGELRSNATITAEYVFLHQALGLDLSGSKDNLRQWLLSNQNNDGSWSIAPDHLGDVSTTTETYLALKILGLTEDDPSMTRARDFVELFGGIARVRIFTRIYLATFGLFPWDAIPEMPAELILMPSQAPINIYTISSWARSTIVPLLIICHHRPVYPLPNGRAAQNDFLDELWYCSPAHSHIPYTPPLWDVWNSSLIALAFAAVDKVLYLFGGLRSFPTRSYARRKCVEWILEHQEPAGDWAGIFPPMHLGILALMLEGYNLADSPVCRGLEAVERFAWQDRGGKRIQACVSPVWDTVLTTIALCDAGLPTSHPNVQSATSWIQSHQILGPEGDWRIYSPSTPPGGFSFEYHNAWYPDIDDTAAVVLAFLKQNPASASSPHVLQATEWVLGMQNRDGGWAAFDKDNDKLYMNKIPFSDMDSLCDPSTADVTGRVIEAFGLLLLLAPKRSAPPLLLARVQHACTRAIGYLEAGQEADGSWYGRWGVNYIYGTSNVLCGLSYHLHDARVSALSRSGIAWLRKVQNSDGGWGEGVDSYRYRGPAGCGTSTPSQTAWALMGLMSGQGVTSRDKAVERGIKWLIREQRIESSLLGGGRDEKDGDCNGGVGDEARTWHERQYTGTGFPGHFYLGYDLYRHYFPMMALGRYVQGLEKQ